MSTGIQFDSLGRDSEAYRAFTASARDLLQGDEQFQAAQSEWEAFFTQSHGDIFGDLPMEDPETALFVDLLYYDFVVDQIIDRVQEVFGFTVSNREPRDNTDALGFSFRALHDSIAIEDSVGATIREECSKDALRAADSSFLRALYETIISREVRLALGEYHTPRGVAELAVDELAVDAMIDGSVLDPGCGSGVFVSVCIERMIEALRDTTDSGDILNQITASVIGIDLNPIAVKSTKLAYLLASVEVLEEATADTVEIPVFLTDALELTRSDTIRFEGEPFEPAVTHLVGNPPWIPWGRLPDRLKDRWRRTYVEDLNLLAHDGKLSRLGHANDDVSVPFVWVCIHQYLQQTGRASFVLKRDLMKGPAGRLFRTLAVGERSLSVTHIHDFNTLGPFGDQVGANTAIYTISADSAPSFPIETTAWRKDESTPVYDSAKTIRETLSGESTSIVPLEPDDPASSWIRRDAERRALGTCEHEIRHGVKDDAQAVFSIDRDQLDDIEPDLVYPYIKSRHIVKYGLFGHELRLVPVRRANEHNEEEVKRRYPETYRYLSAHRETLQDRSSSWLEKGPFYNVFGIGEYTWSAYKVVWCRLGFKPHFAVVSTVEDIDLGEKPVVPGDHYMFIPTESEDQAHYLCGLLNSAIYQRSLKDIASEGKASLSKSVVSQLHIPADGGPKGQRVAELSRQAHQIVPEHTDMSKRAYNQTTIEELEAIQAEIDGLVEQMLAE